MADVGAAAGVYQEGRRKESGAILRGLRANSNHYLFRGRLVSGVRPDPSKTGPKAQINTRSHLPREDRELECEALQFRLLTLASVSPDRCPRQRPRPMWILARFVGLQENYEVDIDLTPVNIGRKRLLRVFEVTKSARRIAICHGGCRVSFAAKSSQVKSSQVWLCSPRGIGSRIMVKYPQ